MKRLYISLLIIFISASTSLAMKYDEARINAWFLTDKMAYELDLTEEQFNHTYEINLDYFLNVSSSKDCYGIYWKSRLEDLRYVLFKDQFRRFCSISYFYYPLKWVKTSWIYPVYQSYHPNIYYFNRPRIYVTYRGGHWRQRITGASWYSNYSYVRHIGLRSRYNKIHRNKPYHYVDYHTNIGGRNSAVYYSHPNTHTSPHFHIGNNSHYRNKPDYHFQPYDNYRRGNQNLRKEPFYKENNSEKRNRVENTNKKSSSNSTYNPNRYRIGKKSTNEQNPKNNSRPTTNQKINSNKKTSPNHSIERETPTKKSRNVQKRPSRNKKI